MKGTIERLVGIKWLSGKVEENISRNWKAFHLLKIFQFALVASIFMGTMPFIPGVVLIFLLDFIDGWFILGLRPKPLKGELYRKYRIQDWIVDYIIFSLIWVKAIQLFPKVAPFAYLWFIATPILMILALEHPTFSLFRPSTVALMFLGTPLFPLVLVLNPLLENWIHGEKFEVPGLVSAILTLSAIILWVVMWTLV